MRGTRERPIRQAIDWSAMRPRDWWVRASFIVLVLVLGYLLLPASNQWWSWALLVGIAVALGCMPALPRKPLDASAPTSTHRAEVDEVAGNEIHLADDEPPLSTVEFQALWQQAEESGARFSPRSRTPR